jgi:glucose-1-phosphate thymidylyltransferase
MKGILLAGGSGSRLYPVTRAITKQLLPVYDKPLIYYPLSVLMLAGIKDILIITCSDDQERFKKLLGHGEHLGITITYAVQDEPRGIAEALLIGEEFIGKDRFCLILGDNIFFGDGLPLLLQETAKSQENVIFGYYVKDAQRYGIVEFDSNNNLLSLEEKPAHPKSHYAVTGIYFYQSDVIQVAKKLQPSGRGELEITDVNKELLKNNSLVLKVFSRGYAWLDTGTHDALLNAGMFVKTIEDRQGLKIGCVEEIAWRMGYISDGQLLKMANEIKTEYGDYLRGIQR